MSSKIKKYADPSSLAQAFASDFAAWLKSLDRPSVSIALSGGSTPKILFELWAREYASDIDWSRIHFFWGDERCVSPNSSESNYGVAKELFFDHIPIPASNIHRIRGEADPAEERSRYEDEIRKTVKISPDGVPQFDLILLGMGEDGHTASIFPHQSEFLTSPRICEVATHPESGQRRITLTGPVLKEASWVAFLITGAGKAEVLSDVIRRKGDFESYPAAFVNGANVCFYLDEAAAQKTTL